MKDFTTYAIAGQLDWEKWRCGSSKYTHVQYIDYLHIDQIYLVYVEIHFRLGRTEWPGEVMDDENLMSRIDSQHYLFITDPLTVPSMSTEVLLLTP